MKEHIQKDHSEVDGGRLEGPHLAQTLKEEERLRPSAHLLQTKRKKK